MRLYLVVNLKNIIGRNKKLEKETERKEFKSHRKKMRNAEYQLRKLIYVIQVFEEETLKSETEQIL